MQVDRIRHINRQTMTVPVLTSLIFRCMMPSNEMMCSNANIDSGDVDDGPGHGNE